MRIGLWMGLECALEDDLILTFIFENVEAFGALGNSCLLTLHQSSVLGP